MSTLILSLLVGAAAGALDALPMAIKKLPKHAVWSAFLQYVVVAVVVFHIDLQGVAWWALGGLVALAMAVPVVVMVARTDKKSVPIILANAAVLGTVIGVVKHFLA